MPCQPIDDTVPRQPFIDFCKGDIAARVINSNITLIQNSQLPLGSLTDKLFSLNIIGRRDKSNITSLSGRTDDEKMSCLLDIVIATIEGNGAVFGQLMEIFEQEGCLRGKTLADTLKNKYNEGKVYIIKLWLQINYFLECLKLESSQSSPEGNFYNYLLNIMTFNNRISQWSDQ